MSTLRVMRVILFGVAFLIACHNSAPAPPPDAIQFGAHDVGGMVPCDLRWNPTGARLPYCEQACLIKPVDEPCNGKTPCNDQGPCLNARDGDEVKDCPSTFTADDYRGQHRGCCLIRETEIEHLPSFYECQPL